MTERVELKYLVDDRAKDWLLGRLHEYLVPAPYTDERAVYPIMSLYFDTPALRFYTEKLDGEAIRNKVRLRGYGHRWEDLDPCFLEVKHKIDARLVKFRKRLGAFQPHHRRPESWPLTTGDDRLAALAHRYPLRPTVQILYQRQAYESPFCPRLRIAFDSRLVALHPDEAPGEATCERADRLCLRETQFIFEIKADGVLPGWVVGALHAGALVERRISKYVLGVEKLGLERLGVGAWA